MEQFNGDVSSNYVYKREDDFCGFIVQHDRRGVEDASYPFGFFWLENKQTGEKWMKDFYVGEENSLHDDIENELMSSWAEEHRMLPQMAEKVMRIGYGLRGRIWTNDKVIAFDQNKVSIPDKAKMKYILHELEMETTETFDDYTYYVSDCEDPNSKTKNWKLVNAYSIREFLTGIADGEKAVDSVNKRNISDFVRDKYAGEKAYQDFQANDPRADRMYKDFVAEHKNRKNMKTLILNERQSRLLRIDECIDDILNEMMAPQNKPTIVTYGGAKCYVCPKTSFEKAAVAAQEAGCKYFRFEGQGENVAYSTAQNLPKDYQVAATQTTQQQTQQSQPVVQRRINNNKQFRIRVYNKIEYTLFPQSVLSQYAQSFKDAYGVTLDTKKAANYYGIDNGYTYIGIDNGKDDAPIWAIDKGVRTAKKGCEAYYQALKNGVNIANKLVKLGFDSTMAIAIAGNIWVESNSTFDPYIVGGFEGHGEGLCQWLGQRKYNFARWANEHYPQIYSKPIQKLSYKQINDKDNPVDWQKYTLFPIHRISPDELIDIELAFLVYEIDTHYDTSGNWKKGLLRSGQRGTLDSLVSDFEEGFEGAKGADLDKRKKFAQAIYNEINKKA